MRTEGELHVWLPLSPQVKTAVCDLEQGTQFSVSSHVTSAAIESRSESYQRGSHLIKPTCR